MNAYELYSFGNAKQEPLVHLEREYRKRLRSFCELKLIELPLAQSSLPDAIAKREEGKTLLKRITENRTLIALDQIGEQLDSQQFAATIEKYSSIGRRIPAFAIGGPLGWDEAVRKRADLLLSLSKLTLPYAVARLIFFEQLYRASTIISHRPYHK